MYLYHLKGNNKINPPISTIQIKKQNTLIPRSTHPHTCLCFRELSSQLWSRRRRALGNSGQQNRYHQGSACLPLSSVALVAGYLWELQFLISEWNIVLQNKWDAPLNKHQVRCLHPRRCQSTEAIVFIVVEHFWTRKSEMQCTPGSASSELCDSRQDKSWVSVSSGGKDSSLTRKFQPSFLPSPGLLEFY